MPFVACLLFLVHIIASDVLESFYPLQTFELSPFFYPLFSFVFFSLLAIAAVLAIYFLLRRRWRQFIWRIFLIVAGIGILFTSGRLWSDYAREHLPHSFEIHVAGPKLALVGDTSITDPDHLTIRIKKLLRHLRDLKEVVFVCDSDIQSHDFAYNFVFPCTAAGFWRFAFSAPNDGHEIDGDLRFNMPTPFTGRHGDKFAGVRIAADGSLSFTTDCNPNGEEVECPEGEERSEGKDKFSSTEESVLGEGRGGEFTAAVVLADMGCRLSDITRTIRRLHESGYKDVVLSFV